MQDVLGLLFSRGLRQVGFTQATIKTIIPQAGAYFTQYTVHVQRAFAATSRSQRAQPYNRKGSGKMTTTVTTLKGQPLEKAVLDSMLRRRMFYTPSFEIYNGVSGLYDYGPPGTALQSNLLDTWRKHFVLEENMLEVDCSVLTPHAVFKTSGHVDKFSDWMCKDPKYGDILRADHFVEEMLEARLNGDKEARGQSVHPSEEIPKKAKRKIKAQEVVVKLDDAVVKEYEAILAQIDNYNGEQLGELINKHDLRCPRSGMLPTPPVAFNLMFQTSIGPSSNLPGFLRPETAQGQFMNFAKLLEFNMGNMPFASASIGKSYRNEISPRAGLLRVREFLMAEIEHYVDPDGGKKHARFHEVEHVELYLLDRHTQLAGQTTLRNIAIGDAVKAGIVDNETLGYFLARIHLFLDKIGIDMRKARFRQHMANEMAHYACDCWDAELLTSSGWVECVGCADRSAYDLTVHSKQTDKPLIVRERLEEPRVVQEWEIDIDKKKFGPHFKKDGRAVEAAIMGTSQHERETLAQQLGETGHVTLNVLGVGSGKVDIGQDMLAISYRSRTENTREYTPNVIEPSFGIGRILFALCEHNYWTRASEGGDEARGVLSFPPAMAPTKVLIVPLSNNKDFAPHVTDICQKLRGMHIACRIDDSSATIGKRYSRNDELGTPLGITVDFQTLKDGTVTLRDRDSMKQVRAEADVVLLVVQSIACGTKTWHDIENELPAFETQDINA